MSTNNINANTTIPSFLLPSRKREITDSEENQPKRKHLGELFEECLGYSQQELSTSIRGLENFGFEYTEDQPQQTHQITFGSIENEQPKPLCDELNNSAIEDIPAEEKDGTEIEFARPIHVEMKPRCFLKHFEYIQIALYVLRFIATTNRNTFSPTELDYCIFSSIVVTDLENGKKLVSTEEVSQRERISFINPNILNISNTYSKQDLLYALGCSLKKNVFDNIINPSTKNKLGLLIGSMQGCLDFRETINLIESLQGIHDIMNLMKEDKLMFSFKTFNNIFLGVHKPLSRSTDQIILNKNRFNIGSSNASEFKVDQLSGVEILKVVKHLLQGLARGGYLTRERDLDKCILENLRAYLTNGVLHINHSKNMDTNLRKDFIDRESEKFIFSSGNCAHGYVSRSDCIFALATGLKKHGLEKFDNVEVRRKVNELIQFIEKYKSRTITHLQFRKINSVLEELIGLCNTQTTRPLDINICFV